MAEKKPIVFYDDTRRFEEMRAGDTAPSTGSVGSSFASSTLVPETSQTIATNKVYITSSMYEITGVLNLTIEGNGKLVII